MTKICSTFDLIWKNYYIITSNFHVFNQLPYLSKQDNLYIYIYIRLIIIINHYITCFILGEFIRVECIYILNYMYIGIINSLKIF